MLRERLFRQLGTASGRSSLGIGAGIAVLTGVAASVEDRRVRGVLAAASAVVPATALVRHISSVELRRQEVRDLWGLAGLMTVGRPLPGPGGWALGADALAFAIERIAIQDLRTVVELGPGVSSVLIDYAASRRGRPLEMVGLEHDDRYCDIVRDRLGYHGATGYRLLHAPLVEQDVLGQRTPWYAPSVVAQLPEHIDLLIVDGPPNTRGRGSRAPAWPLLRDRLSPGALLIVDDTDRLDERRMVASWMAGGRLRVVRDSGHFMALTVG